MTRQTGTNGGLPYAMFTYNTTPHTAAGYTPHELVYGQTVELPTALKVSPRPAHSHDDYAQEIREQLRAVDEVAREQLQSARERSEKGCDKQARGIDFKAGDKVLLYDESVRRGRSKKLESKWIGPYRIIKGNSSVNYTIQKGKKTLRAHASRLEHFIE